VMQQQGSPLSLPSPGELAHEFRAIADELVQLRARLYAVHVQLQQERRTHVPFDVSGFVGRCSRRVTSAR
jgi:hypothetical protein